MVELIEQSRMACDRLIDVTGRAVLQGVLQLCAAQVAEGLPQQGKRPSESVVFYGRQAGQLMLSDRNIQLEPPRLLTKRQGRSKEVEIPVYTAMQDQSQPARTCWIRCCVAFRRHTMMGAVGVDAEGRKHVLGIRKGATENATVVAELLQDIVARGLDPEQKRMFIIDGSKALRAAINAVFGADHPVQQSRARKLRNAGSLRTGLCPWGRTCSIIFPRNRRNRSRA